jgi:C2 domain
VQQLVYPNQLNVPLMENSGLAKPPVGMLEVTIERASGLRTGDIVGKGDPYVRVSVQERYVPTAEEIEEQGGDPSSAPEDACDDGIQVLKEHPAHCTSIHKNTRNPEFNEHFKACPALACALRDGSLAWPYPPRLPRSCSVSALQRFCAAASLWCSIDALQRFCAAAPLRCAWWHAPLGR